jgi:hypothetical protein
MFVCYGYTPIVTERPSIVFCSAYQIMGSNMDPLIGPDVSEPSVSSDRWRLGLEKFPVG